jgi:hypothetical protein
MRLVLLIVYCLMGYSCGTRFPLPKGVTWDQPSGKFGWWGGSVILPVGFSYQVTQGVDTYEGRFSAPNGRVVIRHDIGSYSGAYAKPRERGSHFEEWDEQGSRVWLGHRPWGYVERNAPKLVAVTFPDAGCANFFLESSNPEEFEWISQIAHSFQPKQPVNRGDYCR